MSASLIVDLNGKPIGFEHVLPPLPPLSKYAAESFSYYDGFLRRRGLAEVMRCQNCFSAKRIDGVNVQITHRYVEVKCRCGVRAYHAPGGTTDLTTSLPNSASVLNDETMATVEAQNGQTWAVKAVRLEPEEAAIIRMYWRVCQGLHLKPQVVHIQGSCWDGRVSEEGVMKTMVTDSQVAFVCGCRTLFSQDGPVS